MRDLGEIPLQMTEESRTIYGHLEVRDGIGRTAIVYSMSVRSHPQNPSIEWEKSNRF